jgi:hypothetical protein
MIRSTVHHDNWKVLLNLAKFELTSSAQNSPHSSSHGSLQTLYLKQKLNSHQKQIHFCSSMQDNVPGTCCWSSLKRLASTITPHVWFTAICINPSFVHKHHMMWNL